MAIFVFDRLFVVKILSQLPGAVIENGFQTQEIAFKRGLDAANKILHESEELRNTRLVASIARISKGDSFQASQKSENYMIFFL